MRRSRTSGITKALSRRACIVASTAKRSRCTLNGRASRTMNPCGEMPFLVLHWRKHSRSQRSIQECMRLRTFFFPIRNRSQKNNKEGAQALAEFVKIEKGLGPEERIAVVRFDRGDGINALSAEALRQLTDAARSFEDDSETSVVVLTGGAKAFSAAFDLKDAEGRSRSAMDLGSLRRHLKLGPRLTRAWQEMEQITIGAIEGFCIGGGVALAVALDFRVMGRDAHMRVPEIGLGMNMSWQSIPRMLHLMGPARTKQAVILADQRISAGEAYEWGLVEEVADPGRAFDAAMTLAAKVAAQPPLSVAMTKLTVNRLAYALDDLAGHMDVDQFALASLTEDHKEGGAGFLGRRKPRFRGR